MTASIEQLVARFGEAKTAMLVKSPPAGTYSYELKYDGYRIVAFKQKDSVRLVSRRGQDWTLEFPGVAEAVQNLRAAELVLDGEAVATQDGVPSFHKLQNRQGPISYVTFDLLMVDGKDCRGFALEKRRAEMDRLLGTVALPLAKSTALDGDFGQLLTAACRAGFEGIVGKRTGSSYGPRRDQDWIKLKCEQREAFAVVGYLPYTGSQVGVVGSLILGIFEGGHCVYVGKVGTGFDEKTRRSLGKLLETNHIETPQAVGVPRFGGLARFNELGPVADVKFSEWTEGGGLRHPSYVGLRPDKMPHDCVRDDEQVAKPSGKF